MYRIEKETTFRIYCSRCPKRGTITHEGSRPPNLDKVRKEFRDLGWSGPGESWGRCPKCAAVGGKAYTPRYRRNADLTLPDGPVMGFLCVSTDGGVTFDGVRGGYGPLDNEELWVGYCRDIAERCGLDEEMVPHILAGLDGAGFEFGGKVWQRRRR